MNISISACPPQALIPHPEMRAPATAGGRTGADSADSLSGDRRYSTRPATPTPYLIALRRRRTAERLHRLGPRALYHALDEIGPDAWRIAERYAGRLTPELLAAVGADRFPPAPIGVVQS
ncbi:MAG: hypothetical protein ACREFZ_07280 [Acetobacteraceae bacterium]